MIKIPQKHYGNIEIDTSKKDVIRIIETNNYGGIRIERENIQALIYVLAKEVDIKCYLKCVNNANRDLLIPNPYETQKVFNTSINKVEEFNDGKWGLAKEVDEQPIKTITT